MWTPRHQAMTAHTYLIGFKVHLPVCLPIEKVTTGVRHCSYLLQTNYFRLTYTKITPAQANSEFFFY